MSSDAALLAVAHHFPLIIFCRRDVLPLCFACFHFCRELEAQRDQLQRIQRKVDEVEAHADKSNFILKGMKSMFGSIKNKFSKNPETPKQVIDKREAERASKMEATDATLASKAAERDAKSAARAAIGTTPSAGGAGGPAVVGGAGAGKVTDASLVKDPRLAKQMSEEDELLEQISRGLDGIKAVGEAMNDELIRQDGIIGELGTSMDRASGKVDKVRAAADRIAGR